MPYNKAHDILDDSLSFPYMDKTHVTRAGLMLNTLDKSRPIVLSAKDCDRLLEMKAVEDALSMDKIRELGPLVVQFDGQRDTEGRFIIAVLVVPMQEVSQIHCYPYSNNNKDEKMWPYDKHFMINNVGVLSKLDIQARSTHPLAEGEQLDELAKTHMSALSAIVVKLLVALQQGSATLEREGKDYTKLNKKRIAAKKSTLKPDYFLEWK